jgi:hypothetical protein
MFMIIIFLWLRNWGVPVFKIGIYLVLFILNSILPASLARADLIKEIKDVTAAIRENACAYYGTTTGMDVIFVLQNSLTKFYCDPAVDGPVRCNDIQNALRHCIWTQLLCTYCDEASAKRYMDIHERGEPPFSVDSAKDKENNIVGCNMGKANTPASGHQARQDVAVRMCEDALRRGQLYVDDNNGKCKPTPMNYPPTKPYYNGGGCKASEFNICPALNPINPKYTKNSTPPFYFLWNSKTCDINGFSRDAKWPSPIPEGGQWLRADNFWPFSDPAIKNNPPCCLTDKPEKIDICPTMRRNGYQDYLPTDDRLTYVIYIGYNGCSLTGGTSSVLRGIQPPVGYVPASSFFPYANGGNCKAK